MLLSINSESSSCSSADSPGPPNYHEQPTVGPVSSPEQLTKQLDKTPSVDAKVSIPHGDIPSLKADANDRVLNERGAETHDLIKEEKPTQEWKPVQRPAKVPIRLQAIGSTAAIHPASFSVSGTQSIASVAKYIMKKLRLKSIHVYVSSSFEPTPEELMGELYESFKTNNVLNLSYCESIAFG